MRSVRFNLWQMLLVVALVLGMITAILAGIRALLPQFQLPWLFPLLTLATIDAVVTQRIATRERLSFGEQGFLRLVEWTLLVVVVRVASLAAEGVALIQALQPWLRDPLAFFGGQFATYLLPTVIAWGFGTALAQAVLAFETELPREGVRSLPSEEAAVVEDRVLALAQFDRYWLGCTLIALTGAAVALYQMPILLALRSWATALPVVAVVVCLIAGLVLHSQGQLDRLRYGWQIEQIQVDSDVPRRWRRVSGLLILAASVIALLLSQGTLWVPPPPLVPILNALMVVITFIVTLIVAFFSLLLFPFAWLLSLLTGTGAPSAPLYRPIPPPQIVERSTERPLLPALIFWSCIAILIGLAAVRYVQQRQDMRTLVGRWPGVQWLLHMLGLAWRDVQNWSTQTVQAIQRRLRRSPRSARPRTPPPAGAQAQLRMLYRRMVHSAEQRGVPHSRSQTPYEFRAALGAALPPAEADVSGLTDVYVAAEYGPQPAQPGDVRRARKHWRRIKQRLARLQRWSTPLGVRRRDQ
jgi:hypothetical protein